MRALRPLCRRTSRRAIRTATLHEAHHWARRLPGRTSLSGESSCLAGLVGAGASPVWTATSVDSVEQEFWLVG